ncbi:MAG: rRNA maturation RNase YbeY [Patescibacteria group bacterium]
MISVYINREIKASPSDQEIKKILSLIGKKLKFAGQIEINIIGESVIKKLNKKYRKKDKVTDVLSFAWQEDKIINSDFIGQIYICYPQIQRQAKEFKVSAGEEFIRILTHGVLHLLGYDHVEENGAKKMFKIQEDIVKKFL